MNMESIKQLIRNGEFPQACGQLRDVLSKDPNDTIAQMLYGTCCQVMGDTETFGRIYQRLAPEMERCVKRGERSERAAMWLKYAAMFAMLLMCGPQLWAKDGYSVTLDDADSPSVAMSANGENEEFARVMKLAPHDRLLYFLKRPEVSRELQKGNARAIFIPLRENGIGWFSRKADNLLLICADSSLKTASDVVRALKDAKDGENKEGKSIVKFSPFKQIVDPKSVERLVSSCEERIKTQEERIKTQEERIKTEEERIKLPEDDRIRKIEDQVRTVDDRIRKNEFSSRLGEFEEELRSVKKRREAIESMIDYGKQKQSLEERRKEKLTPEEAEKLEKQIWAIDERVREIGKNNSIPRRRDRSRQLLLDLQQREQDLSEKIEWIKSESRNGLSTREELKAEREQLEAQRQQLLSKHRELTSEQRKIEVSRQNLELEHRKLEAERSRLGKALENLKTTRIQAQSEIECLRSEIECLRNGEMIPSRYNLETLPKTLCIALQDFQERGKIADLILSSDESGFCVLGITDEDVSNDSIQRDYEQVMKLSQRDRMLYFLKRPEVSRELRKGGARAVIIPVQVGRGWSCKADNIVLIRVSSELKTGADLVAALKRMDNDLSNKAARYDDDEDEEDYHREKTRADGVLVQFSPFECAAYPQFDDESVLMLEKNIRTLEEGIQRQKEWIQMHMDKQHLQQQRRGTEEKLESDSVMLESLIKELRLRLKGGEMIPSAYAFSDVDKNHYHIQGARKRVFQTIAEHGEISDLIISSDEMGYQVLGVSYVNVYGALARTKYMGPRDYGDRFPKYVIAPDGKVLYELTEEMVRKQMEEERKRWEIWQYGRPVTNKVDKVRIIVDDDDDV